MTNLNFLKKAMQVTEIFFENRLKVSTIARIYAPSTCQDFNPSSNDVSNGISSSDLHIYVRYVTDSTIGYGATGKSCKWVSSLTLPDLTLQQGRPTIGRIIFNTYNIIDDETSLTNRLFAEITATSIHETIHILGFDYSLYSSFLNPSDGNTYTNPVSASPLILHGSRSGGGNYILQTPFVTTWAQ